MRWRTRLWPALAFLALLAYPLTANAGSVVLVDNLYELSNPGNLASAAASPSGFYSTLGQEFTVNTSATLQNIIVNLGNLYLGNSGDMVITAQLYSVPSASTPPDVTMGATLIDTLTLNPSTPIPTSGFSNVEYDPMGTDVLSPGTNYWFTITATSASGDTSGMVSWQYTLDNSYSGPGSLPNYATYDGGWSVGSGSPNLIQVNGIQSVPEPSSWILGGIGFSTMVLAGRKLNGRRKV